MGNYDDFNVLKVLTKITGVLINQTPLRVGGSKELQQEAVDITPIKIKFGDKEVPYIPGSSIKGVLRSLAEAILRAEGRNIHEPWDFEAVEKEKDAGFCPICGIFGNTAIASHVRIFDAYPVDSTSTFLKTGVGINRDFRGAQPGVLYTEEQVLPFTKWSFRMDVINIKIYPKPEDERGRILREIINMLKLGMVQVGARKTIGYGSLKLEGGKYEIYGIVDGFVKKIGEGEIP